MQPEKHTTVNITNRTIVRTILWIVAAVLVYKFIGQISHVLLLIFTGFFLALALNPWVNWWCRMLHIKSRIKGTIVSFILAIAFLGAFFYVVIPPLVQQTRTFIKNVPQTIENFQKQDSGLARTVRKYNVDEKLVEGAKQFASHYGGVGSTVFDTGKRIIEAVASLLAVLVLAFMMLVEGPKWLEFYYANLPSRKRERHKKLAYQMYRAVTGFVNGQVILATVAGIFAFIALEIAGHVLDVPSNAVALGGIVAVFGIIPLFGNPTAAIIVILVSLLNSVTLAVVMAAYFIVYFFIENHTFQPFLQSRLNQLSPLTVFIAALIGVAFGGLFGAIIAIPAASTVKILVEDYYEQRGHVKPTIPRHMS